MSEQEHELEDLDGAHAKTRTEEFATRAEPARPQGARAPGGMLGWANSVSSKAVQRKLQRRMQERRAAETPTPGAGVDEAGHEAAKAGTSGTGVPLPHLADAVRLGDVRDSALKDAEGEGADSDGLFAIDGAKPVQVQLDRKKGAAGADKDAKKYLPRLVPSPKNASALLGQVYTQSVSIENASEAPKGTTYEWKYEMKPGSMSPTGKADLDGPTSSFPMILRSVGENSLTAAVYTKSPGLPNEVDTTTLTISVPPTTLVSTKQETEKGGKRRPLFESMLVDEDLVVTIELGQIDKNAVDVPRELIQVPEMTHVKTVVVRPGVYEIFLHPGPFSRVLGGVAVLPFDTRIGQVPYIPVQVDVEPPDSNATPDTRPVDVEGAKSWLHADYTNLFAQMRLGNDALVRQSQDSDPPPKSPLWLDILLGAVTAAFGGASAAIGMAIADKLVGKHLEGERLHEGMKVFFENTLTTSVKEAMGNMSKDPKEMSGDLSPHMRFFTGAQTALNTTELKMKQEELTNRVNPRIDALENQERGKGFRTAVELDRALKAAIQEAAKIEFEKSLVEWVRFITRGQLGSVNKDDPDAATDMAKQLSTQTEGFPTRGEQSASGVIAIEVDTPMLGNPEVPVTISKSIMHGMNETLRKNIGTYLVKELPFAVTVRGNAPGRFDGPWAFSRNESGRMWLSNETHEYLEKKGHGTAREGANKIFFQEIGNEQLKPTS